MVQARENLSAITGTVRSVGRHPELDGWDLVELELTAKEPVDGYADLLDASVGDTVQVGVRHSVLGDDVHPGDVVRCRVRVGRGTVLAENEPDAANFALVHPHDD
jgi:hypothetical protein